MSYAEFLKSTPPEINIKVEAWNDARRREASRDYELGILISIGINDPKKFPRFEKFYPEKVPEPPKDQQLEDAMEIARKLGHI
jgi:hypothetical protein